MKKNYGVHLTGLLLLIVMLIHRLNRLTARENIDNAKAQTMLMAQASREQRVQLGDHLPTDIIDNNSKISDLKDSIESLSQKLFALV